MHTRRTSIHSRCTHCTRIARTHRTHTARTAHAHTPCTAHAHLGTEVERHDEASCAHVLLERLEDTARLAGQAARRLVQRDDAVHA
eukprot:scaffold30187_cov58-Phaeocystis_antarctica.AAC.1